MSLYSHYETTDLGNGQIQHEQYIKSIAYLNNGLYRHITNVLGSSSDPSYPVGVDELSQFRLKSNLAGQSPVLFFGKGNTSIRWTPLGTNNTNGEPIGDSGWKYPEAWNNADLRLIMAGHRLQKDIILRSGHPSSFQFRIDENAGLDFDTLETDDFRILQPYLTDGVEIIPLIWQKATQGQQLILTVDLPVGDYSGWVLDPTIELQPDATDGEDNFMISTAPTSNFGTFASFRIGDLSGTINRASIRFDLSSLPDAAIISSTTLSLYLLFEFSSNNRTMRVYRSKRVWSESQSTWNNYDTGTPWQTSGGFGSNDAEQTDIGSRAFTSTETANEFKDFSLTATAKNDLDYGLENGGSATGWLIKNDTENNDRYDFASSDNATAINRPKLTIVYTEGGGGLLPILQSHGVAL